MEAMTPTGSRRTMLVWPAEVFTGDSARAWQRTAPGEVAVAIDDGGNLIIAGRR